MPAIEPVDCLDIEEARLEGRPLEGALAAHAERCPVCRHERHDVGAPATDAASFDRVAAELAEERGVVATLRSLPTRTRGLAAAVVGAGLAVLAGALFPPNSAGAPAGARRIVAFTAFATTFAALVRLALRPLHVAPPSNTVTRVAVIAAFGLPILLAFLPVPPDLRVTEAPHHSHAAAAFGCFALGAAAGALLVAALRALDRGAHAARRSAIFAAAAGGLAGNLALALHCSINSIEHLLLGHATVVLALVFGYSLFRR
jgi:hypothetical protein